MDSGSSGRIHACAERHRVLMLPLSLSVLNQHGSCVSAPTQQLPPLLVVIITRKTAMTAERPPSSQSGSQLGEVSTPFIPAGGRQRRRLALSAGVHSKVFMRWSHNGAQQIIVSSQRDGFHPRASLMWRRTGLNSYVELSAAATETDSSSSIMEEGKQPGPFSISANVREKDRSQELTAAEVEGAENPSPEEMDGVEVPAAGFSFTHRDIYQRKLRAQSQTNQRGSPSGTSVISEASKQTGDEEEEGMQSEKEEDGHQSRCWESRGGVDDDGGGGEGDGQADMLPVVLYLPVDKKQPSLCLQIQTQAASLSFFSQAADCPCRTEDDSLFSSSINLQVMSGSVIDMQHHSIISEQTGSYGVINHSNLNTESD
ncbi:hypothetical protein PAMP_023304 [Pampus punctatissimus]